MAIPFTVDISAFYGEPDFREQDSGTIVDRRKTLNLYKELETPVNAPVSSKRKKGVPKSILEAQTPRTGAIGIYDTGGDIGFINTNRALAFNKV